MGLQVGIVGLPNVGKSTTFNALTKAQNAAVANYPFCTIQPNRAVVPVPDPRVDRLANLANLGRRIQTTIEFVDIAGLVKGASHGEGLGNQFLGNIRDTNAILHIVRCFEDPNVAHVSAEIDPRVDIETVNLELILADLQQLEKKIERLERQVKGDKKFQPYLRLAEALRDHLDQGLPINVFPGKDSDTFANLNNELRFLTAKPVIYAANVDEDSLAEDNLYVLAARQLAQEHQADFVKFCAQFEQDLIGLTDAERSEFLEMAGIETSALDLVIRTCYERLGLISFFTMNEQEVRAWTLANGSTASQAAGAVHTDFERGFIRAEVIPFQVYDQFGSAAAVKAAGELQLEGRDYVVQDGDVIYIRFNV